MFLDQARTACFHRAAVIQPVLTNFLQLLGFTLTHEVYIIWFMMCFMILWSIYDVFYDDMIHFIFLWCRSGIWSGHVMIPIIWGRCVLSMAPPVNYSMEPYNTQKQQQIRYDIFMMYMIFMMCFMIFYDVFYDVYDVFYIFYF